MATFWGILARLADAYILVVIVQVILSWVRLGESNPLVQLLNQITEPVYRRIRGLIRTSFGGFDFAPLLLIVALSCLQRVLLRLAERS
jgi:YggT family protein